MSQHALFTDSQAQNAPSARRAARVKKVLVPFPVDKAYSYGIPEDMEVQDGDYVTVPLGNREVAGVVWGDSDEDVPPAKLKDMIARYDLPPMPESHRKFIDWTAHYNMAPKGFVMKMALSAPAALEPPKPVTGYALPGWIREILNSPHPLSSSPHPDPPPKGGRGKYGKSSEHIINNARKLRSNMTEAEKKLWSYLRKEQMAECKFRRQHLVANYIVDFVCLEKNLVIELDGGQHSDNQEQDKKRTAFLEAQGFKIIRFWNNEVFENIKGVLETINTTLTSLPTTGGGPGRGGSALISEKEKFLKNLSPQRRRVLEVLQDGIARRAAEISDMAGCTPAVIRGMADKELLDIVPLYSAAPCRTPHWQRDGVMLSDAQDEAAQTMKDYVRNGQFHAALLDGVTGAGKTEVYFEAIAEALKQDKQVLLLLPEIALSNAFLERFKNRFGCAPAMWHSHLSAGQRKTTWRGVAEGQTKVVVGARSALYLPYQNLGLIVVDEEHDPAYKQEDGVIYHARDMAIVRAHIGKFPVILVSATPSLETISNCWAGRYAHLHLPDRHGGARLPDMHLIDMKVDKPDRQHFISPPLLQALEANLEAQEQSLLFLNRRGYAPLTLCRSCGHRMACPRCTAWLVEHKKRSRLECHHCGYFHPVPKQCPECSDTDSFAACGPGVERIFEEVTTLLPDARCVILASDMNDDPETLKSLLADIRAEKYDIVIGTQIIAKGHHFPRLTLVGVIDADLGLQGGDLRAAERTYQLLHQVAGRAGREELPGRVYLQTFYPDNKVMQALAGHERDNFLEVESYEREMAHMPPFSRLAGIIVSGKDERQVIEISQLLGKTAPYAEGIMTLGPADAPFYRLRGNYRRRLLVRADKKIDIQKALAHWIGAIKIPSTIRVYIDIDPQSFF